MQKIKDSNKKILVITALLLTFSAFGILFSIATYAQGNQIFTESQTNHEKNNSSYTKVVGTDSSSESEYIKLSE